MSRNGINQIFGKNGYPRAHGLPVVRGVGFEPPCINGMGSFLFKSFEPQDVNMRCKFRCVFSNIIADQHLVLLGTLNSYSCLDLGLLATFVRFAREKTLLISFHRAEKYL